jgi:hypothetical protein
MFNLFILNFILERLGNVNIQNDTDYIKLLFMQKAQESTRLAFTNQLFLVASDTQMRYKYKRIEQLTGCGVRFSTPPPQALPASQP